MEGDVARRDKIAAAKKKVHFTLTTHSLYYKCPRIRIVGVSATSVI